MRDSDRREVSRQEREAGRRPLKEQTEIDIGQNAASQMPQAPQKDSTRKKQHLLTMYGGWGKMYVPVLAAAHTGAPRGCRI